MYRIEKMTINAANLGENNPMADIRNVSYLHAKIQVKDDLNEEERRYISQGMIDSLLPYTVQDGYDRDRRPTEITTVVLENKFLKAVFLPGFGGKLWSLYDKVNGRDLLYTNTVMQPCNFALRNAWMSGGVEFNIGIKGHTPLTCSPMWCEQIGDSGVRMYEFERKRGLAYSITSVLPEDSDVLYVRTRVENTSDETKWMYWWSNIAVPETENTRVLVPADDSIQCFYEENHYEIGKSAFPISNGVDVSYPSNIEHSTDYFYCIPKNENKWVAAVRPDGTGLLQFSTDKLAGRKLFLWGQAAGGRHWGEFLSEPGQAYIEIQAGYARTQFEHAPMPGNTVLEWTEGYTAIDGTKKELYSDWNTAKNTVKSVLRDKKAFEKLGAVTFPTEAKPVFNASGWGALENRVRKLQGGRPISEYLTFPSIDDVETKQWNHLIDEGYLPCPRTEEAPVSYVIGEFWRDSIEKSAATEKGKTWYTFLMLGATKYELRDIEGAKKAWENSVGIEPSLWAYRNLAMLYKNEFGDIAAASKYMDAAAKLAPATECRPFLYEYGTLLTDTGRDDEWMKLYETLNPTLKAHGRLRICVVKALLNTKKLDEASAMLSAGFVLNDVKEGELSVSKLWQDIHRGIVERDLGLSGDAAVKKADELYPLPYELDFRMQ